MEFVQLFRVMEVVFILAVKTLRPGGFALTGRPARPDDAPFTKPGNFVQAVQKVSGVNGGAEHMAWHLIEDQTINARVVSAR